MLRTIAAISAAVVSLVVAPAAQAAEPTPVSIDVNPGHAMYWNSRGWWEIKASYGRFSVDITDTGDEVLHGTTIFVSIPDDISLSHYSGEGWTCESTDGGIDCENTHQVDPGEAWPRLEIGYDVHTHMSSPDSIDVYAVSGDHDLAHGGIPFKTDTMV